MRRWMLVAVALSAGAVLMLGIALPVAAHAELKSATPPDKAVLAQAPAQITLIFTEETSATKSGGQVTGPNGAVVSTGFKVDLNNRNTMTITLASNLPNGAYIVRWRTFAEDDNSTEEGSLTFTVQSPGSSSVVGTVTRTPPGAVDGATTSVPTFTPPPIVGTPTAARVASAAPTVGAFPTTTAPASPPAPDGGRFPWLPVSVAGAIVLIGAGFALARSRGSRGTR